MFKRCNEALYIEKQNVRNTISNNFTLFDIVF